MFRENNFLFSSFYSHWKPPRSRSYKKNKSIFTHKSFKAELLCVERLKLIFLSFLLVRFPKFYLITFPFLRFSPTVERIIKRDFAEKTKNHASIFLPSCVIWFICQIFSSKNYFIFLEFFYLKAWFLLPHNYSDEDELDDDFLFYSTSSHFFFFFFFIHPQKKFIYFTHIWQHDENIYERKTETEEKCEEIDDDGLWSTMKIYINSLSAFASIILFDDVSIQFSKWKKKPHEKTFSFWRRKKGHIKLSYIYSARYFFLQKTKNRKYSHKQTNVDDDVARWSIFYQQKHTENTEENEKKSWKVEKENFSCGSWEMRWSFIVVLTTQKRAPFVGN